MPSLFRPHATRNPSFAALLATFAFAAALTASQARAADEPIFAPGQPIVTGFPGILAPEAPPADSDPLDYTFIDPAGASMVIHDLQPDAGPAGQLIESTPAFAATAQDVGLVFGVTLDNAPELTGADAPNIYLSATSAFGLHIVVPDGDGNPIRSKTGAPDATYMPGQWGSADGATGYPGSIWKVDGETGEITLFTTIAANSGAGLGDLVYDPGSAQFFVSDLDTGLIYRLYDDGVIADVYDHGVTGRPEHALDPVEDDGSVMAITDPAFNSEDPATWGFTQPERKVFGLALWGGRLFYTVRDPLQVWSVRINADGSFGAPRWELDITGLVSDNEVTDIAFDPQGRMLLAQRGPQTGSYDYSVFAEPGTSSVVRFKREFPADDTTPSTWVETPDTFAIGMAADGANASGGIALGPNYDEDTGTFSGACDAFLWTTGDLLRLNPDLDPPLDEPFFVAGLQGNAASLVRPDNEPPMGSFFVDHDGNTEETEEAKAGHVGSIAFWQDCTFDAASYVEPPFIPDDDYEPEWDDEEEDGEENLTLEKWASPYDCFDDGLNWLCNFTIRVENTGDEPYWGPVVVDDYLPDNNPGALMDFWPQPPWHCSPTGPSAYQCVTGPVLLYPGDGITLHELVTIPKAMVGYCELVNVAGLSWFWDDDDDPSDDFNVGVAGINAPGCVPPGGGSDLSLQKIAFPGNCFDAGADFSCSYLVTVQNAGPDNYSGPIQITDTLGVNVSATVFGPAWNCVQAGPILTCDIIAPPVNVPPGWTSGFVVTAHIPKPAGPPLCDIDNKANIAIPAAGSPTNFNGANDFDSAVTHVIDPACFGADPVTDIQVQKSGLGCGALWTVWVCEWQITITNIGPDPYVGPFSMLDTNAGTTYNTLPDLYPFCSGAPQQITCETGGPAFILPAVPYTFTFHTVYEDGPDVCSTTNNISVTQPNSGSPQNPAGNDSASVMQAIPNPGCIAPLTPRLNITKTAAGCYDDPSSTDWLCDFDIAVLNYGTGPQPGPIDVWDFNDKPTTFTGTACVPWGVPGAYTCTLPGPLNAGATWSFSAQTRVNPLSVNVADCNVINTVVISNPPSGGDPGYISQATQKVPQLFVNLGPGPVAVYCDPPSLELTKTHVKTVKSGDGYDATFTVRATSTGPDPYNGTVEVDDLLPDGTSFVSSTNWSCVPTTGNDVHCSSTFKTIPVGKYTEMTITMHIPTDVAIASKCVVTNTVTASIAAEVLHADEGYEYLATADAELPASLCREPGQCPVNQIMPGGECCEDGTVWNGKQCAAPRPRCPADSHANNAGECVCDEGTKGEPGSCEPIQSTPVCPDDSRLRNGQCQCLPGTEGRPGRCTEIEEEPEELSCPRDSRIVDGECVCRRGTEGTPGKCRPIEEDEPEELTCPRDSRIVDGECVCRRGTEGSPGDCRPIEAEEPEELTCPKDSRVSNGTCVCRRGTEGSPGNCRPIVEEEEAQPEVQSCPDDSHFDTRRNACVCNRPLRGTPGKCVGLELNDDVILLEPRQPILKFPTIN